MKLSSIYAGLLATTFAGLGMATITINQDIPTSFVGDKLDLHFETSHYYSNIRLECVRRDKDSDGKGLDEWTPYKTIFKNRVFGQGNHTYTVVVPNLRSYSEYAFWIHGYDYANQTNWFTVRGYHNDIHKHLSTGQIIGVTIGVTVTVTLCVVAALIVLAIRHSRNHKHKYSKIMLAADEDLRDSLAGGPEMMRQSSDTMGESSELMGEYSESPRVSTETARPSSETAKDSLDTNMDFLRKSMSLDKGRLV